MSEDPKTPETPETLEELAPLLSEADLKHHRWIVAQLDTIPAIEEEERKLAVRKMQIFGGRDLWIAYTNDTYKLEGRFMLGKDGSFVPSRPRTVIPDWEPRDLKIDPEPPHPADVWRQEHPEEAAARDAEEAELYAERNAGAKQIAKIHAQRNGKVGT